MVHAFIGTLFYAFLHQGGSLRANIALERHLSQLPHGALPGRIAFWKAFTPPRHLFLPTGFKHEAEMDIWDPRGRTTLDEFLTDVQSYNGSQYLVFPQHHSSPKMDVYLRDNYHLLDTYGIHLDPDHMTEFLQG